MLRSRLRAEAIGTGGVPMRSSCPLKPDSSIAAAISALTPNSWCDSSTMTTRRRVARCRISDPRGSGASSDGATISTASSSASASRRAAASDHGKHAAVAHQRDVGIGRAAPQRREEVRGDVVRRRQRDVIGGIHHFAVEQLVLEEEHRIAPAQDRVDQQRADVVAVAAIDDGQSRHRREQVLGALAVRGAVAAAAAARRADDQRHRHVAEHAGELHRVVEELVHAQRQEVREHDFHHRQEAVERQADRGAGDARLADRRRDHAAGKVGRQALRHLEGAAVGVVQILAEQQRARVGLQQVPQRRVEGLAHAAAGRRSPG